MRHIEHEDTKTEDIGGVWIDIRRIVCPPMDWYTVQRWINFVTKTALIIEDPMRCPSHY